jgi:hypothetical protein
MLCISALWWGHETKIGRRQLFGIVEMGSTPPPSPRLSAIIALMATSLPFFSLSSLCGRQVLPL